MAYMVMAHIVMAHILVAYVVMAYLGKACIVMAHGKELYGPYGEEMYRP